MTNAAEPGPPLSQLCHRCGSTTFELIDESHVRCVECGHGATFTHLEVVANPDPSPADRARAAARRREHEAQASAAFELAPFQPYGLDQRWSGLRWFGGHGGSGDRTTSLTLAFSDDPRDANAPEIRVETRLGSIGGIDDPTVAAKMAAFTLARQQVDHLWRATGALRDDVRRSTFPRDGMRTEDPTSVWDRARLPVDDSEVEFAVLSEKEHWVAQAIIGDIVVGIHSRHWRVEMTGLVAESDFGIYRQGAQAIWRLMTQ
jgi:hypothetical protein